MLKIESNLKINGRHWGLAFVDGIAYTANVALAAKLLLKGYAVTDQQPEADQPVAGAMIAENPLSSIPSSAAQADTVQAVKQSEASVSKSDAFTSSTAAEPDKPRTTRPRTKAVTADAAGKH